ncbi:hypothetical protein Hanom_Chr11g01059211 [Helianthus anomalus]
MMEDKFGHKKLDSSESKSDCNDEGGDDGDAGATGAFAAVTTGASSARGDADDSESDNNQLEPGYEFYIDDHGERKLEGRERAGSILVSSVQPTVSQQEIVHEAEMDPNLGLTAEEASAIISSPPRSTEPPPMVSSTTETPIVTPQAEPAHKMASTIRATTSQHRSERQQTKFSEMQPDEKGRFLILSIASCCRSDR